MCLFERVPLGRRCYARYRSLHDRATRTAGYRRAGPASRPGGPGATDQSVTRRRAPRRSRQPRGRRSPRACDPVARRPRRGLAAQSWHRCRRRRGRLPRLKLGRRAPETAEPRRLRGRGLSWARSGATCVRASRSGLHERLLDLLPVYTPVGRRLVQLYPVAPGTPPDALAWALAERACRSWLRGGIPPQLDTLDACVYGLEWYDKVTDGRVVLTVRSDAQRSGYRVGRLALISVVQVCARASSIGDGWRHRSGSGRRGWRRSARPGTRRALARSAVACS
ncbi:MAG: hypothetical protein QOI48_3241 [Solirubrobacteraceae bacterium]|nr:hypothetical protein [Solirubrobacteraceae bacterium]